MDDGLDRTPSKDLRQLAAARAFVAPYWRQVAIAGMALVVTASVTLSIGQGMRLVIDQGLGGGSADVLSESLGVFALLVLLLTVGTFTRFYFVSWVGERVSADIRRAVYAHLIQLHPGFFERNQPTEIQSRITTDTTLIQTVIGSSVSIALRNALMFAGGLVLLFVTNAKLSLIVVVCVPLVVAPIVLFGRRVRRLSRSSQDTLAEVGSHAGTSLRHVKVVQGYTREPAEIEAFQERVEASFAVAVQRIRQRAWLIALVMLLVLAAIAVMVWVGGRDVLSGQTTSGELAAFIFYAFIVAGSVGAISEVYSDLQRAAGAMERLLELLSARSELPEPEQPAVMADAEVPGCVQIDVSRLAFAYPANPEVPVLREVTFTIQPGEMVALVGPSGAGKTTLLEMLQRFYDPTRGSVEFNGVDIRQLPLAVVRGTTAAVPQNPVMFAGSVRDNVRYGNADATEDNLRAAIEAAHAGFVYELPGGLDALIGEDGVGLSGGQRQRLAIARALVCKPKLLLLDEATSALDAESEDHIRESVLSLKGACTVVVIAHRLSTVLSADRIVVLVDGKVHDIGNHSELLARSAVYSRFARLQFLSDASERGGADAHRSPSLAGQSNTAGT